MICIGCGCDDDNACVDIEGVACFWIRQDKAADVGVCSHCPDDAARFDDGDRLLSDFDDGDTTHGHFDDNDSELILPGDDGFDETLRMLE